MLRRLPCIADKIPGTTYGPEYFQGSLWSPKSNNSPDHGWAGSNTTASHPCPTLGIIGGCVLRGPKWVSGIEPGWPHARQAS